MSTTTRRQKRAHLYVAANIVGILIPLIALWLLVNGAVKRSASWFVMPKTSGRRRESPDDFMRAYVHYLKENGYDDKQARPTPKAFAILRGQQQDKGMKP